MTPFQGFTAALSAIVLFLYGVQGFSNELQIVGGDALKAWLSRVTANRFRSFLVGGLATAVLQSSSAITALAVTLVDAGVISFRASLGVLLGANLTIAFVFLLTLDWVEPRLRRRLEGSDDPEPARHSIAKGVPIQ